MSSTAQIWKLPGLTPWLRERVLAGALVDGSEDELYEETKAWVAERKEGLSDAAKTKSARLTKASFSAMINEMLWTDEALRDLSACVAPGNPAKIEWFHEAYQHIPRGRVSYMARELRGKVSRQLDAKTFSAGVGRLTTSEELEAIDPVELPGGRVANPFVIDVRDPDNARIRFLNGPHIGTKFSKTIHENPLRTAFADAQRAGLDAIFITSGLLSLSVRWANGILMVHDARLSGYEFNPDVLDPRYREKAERIRKDLPYDEVTYETLAERFLNLMNGLYKITHKPGGSGDEPEYKGKVYVALDAEMERFIEAAARAELRYVMIRQRGEIEAQVGMVRGRLKREHGKASPDLEVINDLQEQINMLNAEKARTVLSNISIEDKQRFFEKVLAYVVNEIESAIPNCTVIGMGTTVVQAGNESFELYQWRDARPSANMLDKAVKEKAARRTLDGSLPSTMVICHPYSVRSGWTVVESASAPGVRGSAQLFQLPTFIDKTFLDVANKQLVGAKSSIERLLRNPDFEPGAVDLVLTNGMWNAEYYSLDVFQAYETRHRKKKRVPYIYLMIDTDLHYGHGWKEWIVDPVTGRRFSLGTGVMQLMRRDGLLGGSKLPVHGFHVLDDPVQGHHFATEQQPHQHQRPFHEVEQEFLDVITRAGESNDPERLRELLSDAAEMALYQLQVRGEHWVQTQVDEMLARYIDPNVDFFRAVLMSGRRADVVFQGVSQHHGTPSDTRDIAPITFGTGNHFGNTTEGSMTEGFLYERYLRALLQAHTDFDANELMRLVRAPLYGKDHIGWGTVSVAGHYQWGISQRNSPSRKSGLGDVVKNFATNVRTRGDFARMWQGRHTVHMAGDIHRFGYARAEHFTVVTCASNTDTDPYGERGFTPNNSGVLILGLPAGGPDSGPMRVVTFRVDQLRRCFDRQLAIDWERLLPDPA